MSLGVHQTTFVDTPHNGVCPQVHINFVENLGEPMDSHIFSKASFRADRSQWLNQRPLRGWCK